MKNSDGYILEIPNNLFPPNTVFPSKAKEKSFIAEKSIKMMREYDSALRVNGKKDFESKTSSL